MTQQLKILMLEDSVVDAEMVERFLKKEHPGYQFHLAKNKETFLTALEHYRPDVILADNSLPQFDATEALRIVRQQSLHIPFIMVTGTVSEEFAAGIIKAGADDFILKDRLARLPAAVEAALKQQQTEMEKQNAFRKLSESEEKFRCLLESAPDAMVIMNDLGNIQLINAQTEKMFGYAVPQIVGKNVNLLMPDGYSKGPESTGQRKNGQQFPVEISRSPLETAEGLLVIMAIRDITDRKTAEQTLKALEQEIMNQRVQEQERNRIGQELHDNICQILSTAKLYITVAKEDKPELGELVNYPIQLIENSIGEIRALSKRNVTPLKDINLEDVLQTLINNVAQTTSLKTNFAYHVADQSFDDGLKLNTYRMIQEQFNNIVKHASAKNINLSIASEDNFIHVTVSDDGKGFDVNKKRSGIGISNMMNRIESYNGEIQIQSSPGNGCTIHFKFPL